LWRRRPTRWRRRHACQPELASVRTIVAQKARVAIGERLPVLTPEADERMLKEAGFTGLSLFYAGFTFRGWVAYA
jgi:tRNA (cmo5U34)-methyltransferase